MVQFETIIQCGLLFHLTWEVWLPFLHSCEAQEDKHDDYKARFDHPSPDSVSHASKTSFLSCFQVWKNQISFLHLEKKHLIWKFCAAHVCPDAVVHHLLRYHKICWWVLRLSVHLNTQQLGRPGWRLIFVSARMDINGKIFSKIFKSCYEGNYATKLLHEKEANYNNQFIFVKCVSSWAWCEDGNHPMWKFRITLKLRMWSIERVHSSDR